MANSDVTAAAPSIGQRIRSLLRQRSALDGRITAELKRPAPCSFTLRRLKRMRLVANDEIARLLRGRGPDTPLSA